MIRIFDLKIEGQGHKEQRGVLRHYMDNCVANNLLEILQVYLKLYVVHDEIVHAYICSAMLKIGDIHSTLKISIKVTYLDTKTKTKHKKYIMVLAIQFAALLLADERPLVYDIRVVTSDITESLLLPKSFQC